MLDILRNVFAASFLLRQRTVDKFIYRSSEAETMRLESIVLPSGSIPHAALLADSLLLEVKKTDDIDQWYPAVTDPKTVLNFAKMCSEAYSKRPEHNITEEDIQDLDGFGWDNSGLRGHVYANVAKSLLIIAFKGTSTLFAGGGTVSMDKYMDNVMFSCCCARIDITWTPVCGCYLGGVNGEPEGEEDNEDNDDHWWTRDEAKNKEPRTSYGRCNATCIRDAIADSNSYYQQAIRIVDKVKDAYPDTQLWFTGHSLGGAIASLMTVKYQKTAAITFESPGDRLYAQRLGLDRGPFWAYPIWNFGITTDPVYMGRCQGLTTSCYLSGYAMETKCRHGRDCTFNITGKEGKYDVNTHRIDWVIDNVLQGQYELPQCRPTINCLDCTGWLFE